MHVYHVKKQQKDLQNCPVFTAVCDVLTGSRQEAFLETRDPAWVLRTVAILNGSHDAVSEDRELSSNRSHSLLKLGHVRRSGQHAREVVASCRLLPLLIKQIR